MRKLTTWFLVLSLLGFAATPAGAEQASGDVGVARAFPRPDSTTVSPDAQLAFRGVGVGDAREVLVTDSLGTVAYDVIGHADDRGASIVPRRSLTVGVVTVAAPFAIADTDSGSYQLIVAERSTDEQGIADALAEFGSLDGATRAVDGTHTFLTEPDLGPPVVDVGAAPSSSDGSLLFTTTNQFDPGVGNQINISDDAGEIVFSRRVDGATADFKVIEYGGEPALIFFEGEPLFGNGRYTGEWIVLDQSYQEIARFAGTGYAPDLHDVVMIDGPGGPRAILLIYNPVVRDLTDIGGQADATVLELVIQEIDVSTGAVLFEWHSLDEIPVEESIVGVGGSVVDYLHPNSLDVDHDGNLLFSARNTATVYKVDRVVGELMWRLGGAGSDFTMIGTDPDFRLQHDARRRADGTISVFDNTGVSESRGLVFDLDTDAMTATLVRDQRVPGGHVGASMGNVQSLEGGGLLIGWGSGRRYTQFDGTGAVVADGTFRSSSSYRVVRHAWTGQPVDPPAVAAARSQGGIRLAASWNGATEHDAWRFSQVTAGGLAEIVTAPRTGFETVVEADLPCSVVVVVEALDTGTVIGTSEPYQFRSCAPAGAFVYAPGSSPDLFVGPEVDHDLNVIGTYVPVVGDFVGDGNSMSADEILWFAPGSAPDYLWRFDDVTANGPVPVSQQSVIAPATTAPLVGDFNGSGCDDLFWYGPLAESDELWLSSCTGSEPTFVKVPMTVNGSYEPIVVNTGATGHDEIYWYAPGARADYLWFFTDDTFVSQRRDVNGVYEPVVVDVQGDGAEEIIWYAAGSRADYFWQWSGGVGTLTETSTSVPVSGTYEPFVVRSGGGLGGVPTSGAEVFWYAPGTRPDHVWTWNGASFTSTPRTVNGFYQPAVGSGGPCDEFDSIWWYRVGSAGHVWSFETGSTQSRTDDVIIGSHPLLLDVRAGSCPG